MSGVNVEEVKSTLFSMLVSSIITSTMGGGSFLTPIYKYNRQYLSHGLVFFVVTHVDRNHLLLGCCNQLHKYTQKILWYLYIENLGHFHRGQSK